MSPFYFYNIWKFNSFPRPFLCESNVTVVVCISQRIIFASTLLCEKLWFVVSSLNYVTIFDRLILFLIFLCFWSLSLMDWVRQSSISIHESRLHIFTISIQQLLCEKFWFVVSSLNYVRIFYRLILCLIFLCFWSISLTDWVWQSTISIQESRLDISTVSIQQSTAYQQIPSINATNINSLSGKFRYVVRSFNFGFWFNCSVLWITNDPSVYMIDMFQFP